MILAFAPMDGITDLPCRVITKRTFDKYNKDSNHELRLWSEFMTSDGFLACPENTIKNLVHTKYETPIILQIFGGNKEKLVETTKQIQSLFGDNLAGIELNTGCPANNIMKSGGGSALMKDKKATLEIIKAMRQSISVPFSIKSRTGINNIDKAGHLDFLVEASNYCDKISVHCRTLKELYHGDGDRDFIYDLKSKANKNCKIIGNGAIKTYEEIDKKIEKNGIVLDGIMIGQAAIGNPWIFVDYEPTIQEKIDTAIEHLKLSAKYEIYLSDLKLDWKQKIIPSLQEIENINIEKNIDKIHYTPLFFRKYFHRYTKGIPGGKEINNRCNNTTNIFEIIDLLKNI